MSGASLHLIPFDEVAVVGLLTSMDGGESGLSAFGLLFIVKSDFLLKGDGDRDDDNRKSVRFIGDVELVELDVAVDISL